MGRLIVNVPVKDVEADEIWGLRAKKEAHKAPGEGSRFTSAMPYCFVAIERHTKLVLNFALGRRDLATTQMFIEGLRTPPAKKHFQITTDGFAPYRSTIPDTLEDRCDFAQLIKVYRNAPETVSAGTAPLKSWIRRWSQSWATPILRGFAPAIVERQNLTIRMQMRRLTRLTNAFSKKWENLWAAYCLHFTYYNFCRVHRSLRVTPGMEAKITDHIWEIGELLA